MEEVFVSKIEEHSAFGRDESGAEVLLTKTHRITNLQIGDRLAGNFLNEDENPDEFYFEVSERLPANGNRYEQTIKIPAEEVKKYQEILDREEAVEDVKSIYTFKTFTAKFDKGIEVDVKVCNGNSPYVDVVLFENGHEVSVDEPSDSLLGETVFEYFGNVYVVNVIED